MAENKDKFQKIEDEQDNFIEIDKTDEDVLKNPQKELSGGIETEEYDIIPQRKNSEDFEEELADMVGIEIEYTFNGDEVREGLTIYQAATILKRNFIYSAILAAVFFVYMVNIIKNPTEVFSIFLAAMCVSVLCFIWILPKNHIKKTAQAADLKTLNFSMVVYDTCVKIGEENGSFVISFNKEITSIYETDRLFMICAGKERIFILPKRCIDEQTEEKIRTIFSQAMKDNYIRK